jgi:hypothetical protein
MEVLALTRYFAKLSISPESSDGFASVGTVLPKEEATLLPGGLFAFSVQLLGQKTARRLLKWRSVDGRVIVCRRRSLKAIKNKVHLSRSRDLSWRLC